MTEREKFEAWAQMPPKGWDVSVHGDKSQRAGDYFYYHVKCAWEAWQAATDASAHKAIYEDEV